MTDYSKAPYYAISGIGYGKGFTAQEAVDNYVATQLRNHRAENTVFQTRAKFKQALQPGAEAGPVVWRAPDEAVGFVLDHRGLHWTTEDDEYLDAQESERVDLDA